MYSTIYVLYIHIPYTLCIPYIICTVYIIHTVYTMYSIYCMYTKYLLYKYIEFGNDNILFIYLFEYAIYYVLFDM